jgi:hypothetical protein
MKMQSLCTIGGLLFSYRSYRECGWYTGRAARQRSARRY